MKTYQRRGLAIAAVLCVAGLSAGCGPEDTAAPAPAATRSSSIVPASTPPFGPGQVEAAMACATTASALAAPTVTAQQYQAIAEDAGKAGEAASTFDRLAAVAEQLSEEPSSGLLEQVEAECERLGLTRVTP